MKKLNYTKVMGLLIWPEMYGSPLDNNQFTYCQRQVVALTALKRILSIED